jgi:hypothetical protein
MAAAAHERRGPRAARVAPGCSARRVSGSPSRWRVTLSLLLTLLPLLTGGTFTTTPWLCSRWQTSPPGPRQRCAVHPQPNGHPLKHSTGGHCESASVKATHKPFHPSPKNPGWQWARSRAMEVGMLTASQRSRSAGVLDEPPRAELQEGAVTVVGMLRGLPEHYRSTAHSRCVRENRGPCSRTTTREGHAPHSTREQRPHDRCGGMFRSVPTRPAGWLGRGSPPSATCRSSTLSLPPTSISLPPRRRWEFIVSPVPLAGTLRVLTVGYI